MFPSLSKKQTVRITGCLLLVGATGLQAAAPVVDLTSKPGGGTYSSTTLQAPLTSEQRLQRLERMLDNQNLVEMLQRLEMLQQEVQQLRGMLEEQGYELNSTQQRQRDLYVDADRRLGNLERAATQAPSTERPTGSMMTPGYASMGGNQTSMPGMPPESTPGSATPPPLAAEPPRNVEPAAAVVDNSQLEQDTYQQAFAVLKQGQYTQAITEFKNFLARFPSGRYSDNAQYWLGESYYVTRRFDEAVAEFLKIIANPNSQKRGDALLKLGYTYFEQKKWAESRKALEQVVAEFPSTTVARLSEKRLQDLRAAGH